MASKKKKARPATPKKGTKPRTRSKVPGKMKESPMYSMDKCNVPEICEFLEKLSNWLKNDFYPDYKALRIAVCNVEDQAFGGSGSSSTPPRFCTGGGTNEPADPPKPPVW
jgi:hypothetical protein